MNITDVINIIWLDNMNIIADKIQYSTANMNIIDDKKIKHGNVNKIDDETLIWLNAKNFVENACNIIGLMNCVAYMAPEVFTHTSSIGRAADIWSLGCVLIEMVTGKVSVVACLLL